MSIMKKLAYYPLFILLFVFCGRSLAQDPFQGITDGVDRFVKDQKVAGMSAAIAINGKKVWSHAAGMANKKGAAPIAETTLIRTASIAKPMTAIAVMQLVEQGLVKLDEPIQTYIPNYPKPKKGTITVKDLLAHNAGLGGYKSAKEAESQVEYATMEAAMNVFKDRKLIHTPGTQFAYTTYGYVVLGVLIEKVSGKSYETYMQENIWDKVGMPNTGVEHADKTYANKAALYHNRKGKIKDGKKNNLSNRIPGGGFYSTVEDLLKFGDAVADHRLISEESLKLMSEVRSINKGGGNPYGYGWYLYGGPETPHAIIGHTGEQTGTSSMLIIIPARKITIAIMSNTSGVLQDVMRFSVNLIETSVTVDNEQRDAP